MSNYTPFGIIELTGENDAGKTSAAIFLNYKYGIPLKEVAFFHDDVKETPFDESKFGFYVDMKTIREKKKLLEFHQEIISIIEKIPPKKYKAIIFDTWREFGLSTQRWGKANPLQFREQKAYIPEANIRFREEWSEAHNFEATIVNRIKSLTNCLIVTSHLKDYVQSNVKVPGKQVHDLGKIWDTVCNMRLWLRHNPKSGVPIALVLKRISKNSIDENGMGTVVNVLPRRIEPLPEETSIWESVNRYWLNPVGNRLLQENEKPSEFELSILDGTLTKAQKEAWRIEVQSELKKQQEELLLVSEEDTKINERIKALFSEGLSIVAVTQAINNEFQTKFDFAEINRRKE